MPLYSPKLFIRDPWVFVPFSIGVLLQLCALWYTFAHVHPTTNQVFLHYTIIFGVDLVGEWWKIYFLSFSGLAVLLINTCVSFFLYNAEKVMARMFLVYTLIVQIFILIGLFKIISLTI